MVIQKLSTIIASTLVLCTGITFSTFDIAELQRGAIKFMLLNEYFRALSIVQLVKFDQSEADIINDYTEKYESLMPKNIQHFLRKKKSTIIIKNGYILDDNPINIKALWMYSLIANREALKKSYKSPTVPSALLLYTHAYSITEFLGDLGSMQNIPKLTPDQITINAVHDLIELNMQELEKFSALVNINARQPSKAVTKIKNKLEECKDQLDCLIKL